MIQIKKATINHLDDLSKAFDSYRVWYRKTSDIQQATHFLNERISNQESIIYIAIESNTIVGFTQLYPLFSSTRMKKLWLLNDLFVYKDHRGKGISKMLIQKAKDHCLESNACGIILETEKNNQIGNALYPKVDFVLNTTHNYYEWTAR